MSNHDDLLYCYEILQPMQPFEEWVKEIGK